MASLFDIGTTQGPARLLDPGAGAGSLVSAFVNRWQGRDAPLSVTAVEVDDAIRPALRATLADCATRGAESELIAEDFIEWAVRQKRDPDGDTPPFDFCIVNPPYRKLSADSVERRLLAEVGIDVPNLYAAFVALAVRLLRKGGQLVAITPRSFANGPYFRAFRRDLLARVSLRQVHVYDARDTAFADAGVLQENVIFHAVAGGARGMVRITVGDAPEDELLVTRDVEPDAVVAPDDPESFIHLPSDDIAASVARRMRRLVGSLDELGLTVSTGRVVDFRTRANLRSDSGPDTAPLVYPSHFNRGRLRWPIPNGRKPNALAVNEKTASLLLPNGVYVLVKRFTSKEERRRVVAVTTAIDPLPGPLVAFENHLNVFHVESRPLDVELAVGLTTFLNSTTVDLFFRQWSGHTQVNATDLRALPYPSREQLQALGAVVGEACLTQEEVDRVVATHVPELTDDGRGDPLMAHQRVTEAQTILRRLGLPSPQTNERSALTLLALLDLTPDKRWTDVEAPLVGITPMMAFMADHYGKQYAPNSRESVRRQSVQQFVAAGIAVQNPDNPGRPTNSGRTVYQVTPELIDLLTTFGTARWDEALAHWQERVPALRDRWNSARQMAMIAVTLPEGDEVVLSPGGQNPLIKMIIDEFCPRFAPGGRVLYVGDAGGKWTIWKAEAMAALGVQVNRRGKMPDVVVHEAESDLLVVVEAVSSCGPIDPKRHEELNEIFAGSHPDVMYVTAFMERRTLATYLGSIAWDTKAWIAEAPTRLIHFDGDTYLKAHD